MAKVTNRLAALILAATAAVAGTACSVGGDADDDKAGGAGPSVELRLANTGAEIAQTPAVEYFVERVRELSGGKVRIEVVDQWAEFASDAITPGPLYNSTDAAASRRCITADGTRRVRRTEGMRRGSERGWALIRF